MPLPYRVLCFSRDPRLLETRHWVLEKRFDAVTILSIAAMEQQSSLGRSFDLVLLCHTLSAEECESAFAIARQSWPHAKILGLVASEPSACDPPLFDGVVPGLDGPRVLLDKAAEMLR